MKSNIYIFSLLNCIRMKITFDSWNESLQDLPYIIWMCVKSKRTKSMLKNPCSALKRERKTKIRPIDEDSPQRLRWSTLVIQLCIHKWYRLRQNQYKLHLIQCNIEEKSTYIQLGALSFSNAVYCKCILSRAIDLWYVVSVSDFVNDLWFPVLFRFVSFCFVFLFISFSRLWSAGQPNRRPRLV